MFLHKTNNCLFGLKTIPRTGNYDLDKEARKKLLKDGFTMHQYSVYVRHCASTENADVHESRVRKAVPEKGQISILRITDKQYGNIVNIWGRKTTALPTGGGQLEIF